MVNFGFGVDRQENIYEPFHLRLFRQLERGSSENSGFRGGTAETVLELPIERTCLPSSLVTLGPKIQNVPDELSHTRDLRNTIILMVRSLMADLILGKPKLHEQ